MVKSQAWFGPVLFALQLYISDTRADGTGLIGYGKTLYNPTCAFACRNVIRKQKLACTPSSSTENHGTAHNPISTPPKCFVQNINFLKTMALCIDVYCIRSDRPHSTVIADYWASHLGTGTIGDHRYVPTMSYKDAVTAAKQDELDALAYGHKISPPPTSIPPGLTPFNVSSPLGFTTGGTTTLNQTRLVSPVQWQLQYNYLSDFEINEKGHNTMTLTITLTVVLLPILLSTLRFATPSPAWTYLKSLVIYPTLFTHTSIASPTRGQTLFIALLSLLNTILLVAPYTLTQPQASFTSLRTQSISIIGNRAGVMAMGNVVALMLFSGRNNPLLYVTDWSYATYLLMHRWLGYWAVAHTIIHSCMLWGYYIRAGTYAAEVARAYWTWGIVGTVGVCALIPLSMGWMRKRAYEGFVVMHGALTVVFLVGYYYHIWYVYGYNWGYEIWMFAAAGIWALERLMRVIRMGLQGTCTTVVSEVLDTDGEYIRIVIENKDLKRGVAYLCFPTLRWQFWETHPFSVSGAVEADSEELEEFEASPAGRSGPCDTNEKEATKHTIASTSIDRAETLTRKGSTVFFARARSGITRVLAAKALAAGGRSIRLRVLIDGPYKYSSHNDSQIDRCSSILCIAGGVGITACLPFLKKNNAEECKLFWSSRQSGLVAGVAHTLRALPSNVKVEITVGKRLDLDAVLSEEMAEGDGTKRGPLAIVVSGPPGLANDVRFKVTQIGRHSGSNRQYMLVDEAFSW